MPTGYQIKDQAGLYYLSLQVVDWVDVKLLDAMFSLG